MFNCGQIRVTGKAVTFEVVPVVQSGSHKRGRDVGDIIRYLWASRSDCTAVRRTLTFPSSGPPPVRPDRLHLFTNPCTYLCNRFILRSLFGTAYEDRLVCVVCTAN
jgi:hypothetical protein